MTADTRRDTDNEEAKLLYAKIWKLQADGANNQRISEHIASALSEARRDERERCREKITELFPKNKPEDVPPNLFEFNEGIDYARDRMLKAFDEPKDL